MSRTRLFVTTAIIVIGIFDIISVNWFGSAIEDNCGHTISQFFQSLGSYPLITGMLFYLAGHFWGWMTPTIPAAKRQQLLKLKQDFVNLADEGERLNKPTMISYIHFRGWADRIDEVAGK